MLKPLTSLCLQTAQRQRLLLAGGKVPQPKIRHGRPAQHACSPANTRDGPRACMLRCTDASTAMWQEGRRDCAGLAVGNQCGHWEPWMVGTGTRVQAVSLDGGRPECDVQVCCSKSAAGLIAPDEQQSGRKDPWRRRTDRMRKRRRRQGFSTLAQGDRGDKYSDGDRDGQRLTDTD